MKRRQNAGVTLLEVIVTLAMIALIVGLVAPRLMENFGRAKSQAAEVHMNNIAAALQLYYIDIGQYPSEAEGLTALLEAPDAAQNWRGPYVDDAEDLNDPWGRPLIFKAPAETKPFSLSTLGRDGHPGGTGEDTDLEL